MILSVDATPVNPEPSPTKLVAVIIPLELTLTTSKEPVDFNLVAVTIPLEIILPTSKELEPRSKAPKLAVKIPVMFALPVTVRSATEIECPVKTPTLNGEASIHCFDVPYPTSLSS